MLPHATFSERMHAVVPTCRVRVFCEHAVMLMLRSRANVQARLVSSPWATLKWACY